MGAKRALEADLKRLGGFGKVQVDSADELLQGSRASHDLIGGVIEHAPRPLCALPPQFVEVDDESPLFFVDHGRDQGLENGTRAGLVVEDVQVLALEVPQPLV